MQVSLTDKLNEDIKDAMKKGEKERLNALRNLKARFIENKTSAKPLADLDVIAPYYKKLKDSVGVFPEGHEIRKSTEKELTYLAPYMPAEMSEDEVKSLIQSIKSNGATNMGAVMKELTPQIKGRFDGKRANDLVKEALV